MESARSNRVMPLALTLLLVVGVIAAFVLLRSSEDGSPTGHAIGVTPPTPPPNVLLIVADDMGVDKLSAYADDIDPDYREEADNLPETPVIDTLVTAGVRFTDAWSNPTCSPTRGALFTGNHGFRTGVGKPVGNEDASNLQRSATTIAETLNLEGYTSGMFGKWHLGENETPEGWTEEDGWEALVGEQVTFESEPILQGWDMFCGSIDGTLDGYDGRGYYSWIAVEDEGCEGCSELQVIEFTEYATIQAVDDAIGWANAQEGPWMASLTLNAPHKPFELPPEGCSYRPEGDEAPTHSGGIYKEMVECIDIQLGVLFAGIEEMDNTLIIFVGDNGTVSSISEGVYRDDRGKGTLYESGVRVPLVIADGQAFLEQDPDYADARDMFGAGKGAGKADRPRIQPRAEHVADPGSESAELAHVVDIFATIAEAAGAQSNTGLDGISLLPQLSDVEGPVREVVYSEGFSSTGTGTYALRKGNWKIIGGVQRSGVRYCPTNHKLFDLSADRLESEDLLSGDSANANAEAAYQDLLSELDALAEAAEARPWFLGDEDCE